MTSLLSILLPLLIPVVALLFLNLRLSRRFRYPLDFIVEEKRRGPASFLFSSIRAHYDVILDALIALVLALALLDSSGGLLPRGQRKAAVVIDCSRSMLQGTAGARPIDLALKRLEEDEVLGRQAAFALAFDPASGKTQLYELDKLTGGQRGEIAAILLASNIPFFAVDYAELKTLRHRGFGDITLLTDKLPGKAIGFHALEFGFVGSGGPDGSDDYGVYPATARYDRIAGAYFVAFVERGQRPILKLRVWRGEKQGFENMGIKDYSIEERPAGRTVRLSSPGLFMFSFEGAFGDWAADFPVLLSPGTIATSAEGPLSEIILKAFPLLIPDTPRPTLILSDKASTRKPVREGGRLITTRLAATHGDYLLTPVLSLGKGIAAGFDDQAEFPLVAASIANEDLVLAYDGAIQAASSVPFEIAPSPQLTIGTGERLIPAGSTFLIQGENSLRPIAAPAYEYFEPGRQSTISIPWINSGNRRLWFGIFVALVMLKLFIWKRVSGKKLL